jgi:hypothetical protein
VDPGDLGWCSTSGDSFSSEETSSLVRRAATDDTGEEVIRERSVYEKSFKDKDISED